MRDEGKKRFVAAGWMVLAAGAAILTGACRESSGPDQPGQAAQAPARFASADELLTALETADQGLHRLQAGVAYSKIFSLGGDVQLRIGKLYYASDPPPAGAPAGTPDHKRFAVEFTQFFRDDRREDDVQSYAFDGQWLMERHPNTKEFHLRQVVRPGEEFDPLKIGQGPFPLPIGQKKDAILAEYDAALLPIEDGLAVADPANASDAEVKQSERLLSFVKAFKECWQVRLTPKAGQGKDPEFSEVRLWYMRDKTGRLLPCLARTVAAVNDPAIKGDVSLVQIINPTVNEEAKIDENVFSVKRPDGWQGDVEELPKQGQPDEPPNPGR